MEKTFFSFLLSLLLISTSQAQVTTAWISKADRNLNVSGQLMKTKADNSGNIYTAFDTYSANSPGLIVLVKYSSSGKELWRANYGGTSNFPPSFFDMGLDNSGNIYITGINDGNQKNLIILKYNPSGNLLWTKLYNSSQPGHIEPYTMAVDVNNNIIITGYIQRNNNANVLIVKYDSDGSLLWANEYDSEFQLRDNAAIVKTDAAGNIFTGGRTQKNTLDFDYLLLKYNSSGVLQWKSTYDGPSNLYDGILAIAFDNAGNIFVTGGSDGVNGASDYATIKYSPDGVQQWAARYDEPLQHYEDIAFDIAVDNSGNSYVTGTCPTDVNNSAIVTIKYDANGNELWKKRYTGTGAGRNLVFNMKIDVNSNLYIAGLSKGINTSEDAVVVKYSSAGDQLWASRYVPVDGSVNYYYSIALDNSGDIIAAGLSKKENDFNYIITSKYSQTTGISNVSGEVPDNFSLSQNYPNPFNPETKIRFQIAKPEFVTLKIYNSLGKEVRTLLDGFRIPGTYEVNFSALELSGGVYFYRMSAGNFEETKKMTLIK